MLISLRIRTFARVRSSVRRTLTRVSDALVRLSKRAIGAFRVRTTHERKVADPSTSAETQGETLPTRVTSAVVNTLIDRPLLLIGRSMTGTSSFFKLNRLVARLKSEGRLVGVVCLDSRSLVPGWLVSRLHPEIAVLTAYPDDWTRDLVDSITRFETGTRWI
jgi:hypothetical protein